MPFANYTNIAETAQAFGITLQFQPFVNPLSMPVSQPLKDDLNFAQGHVAFYSSEFAICENLIYPVLKEAWKLHTDSLTVWSHMPLNFNADLSGTPDYFVARKSPLGHWVMDKPLVAVVEAKKDDFSRGWGQCLAAMLAAQGINGRPGMPIFGISTNGRVWEFGRLDHAVLTCDPRTFTLTELDNLCAAVNSVFEQCRRNVLDPSRAA